jgi:hypothetical protein
MKLNSPKRKNGKNGMYCGPAALCAVTGMPYEEIREVVNHNRSRKPTQGITGMCNSEIAHALHDLGIKYKGFAPVIDSSKRRFRKFPTLNQFLKGRSQKEIDSTLIISLSEHFVTVRGFLFVDNHTKHPVLVWNAPHLKSRVRWYWVLED